jgi:hypothetical protein
MDRADALLDRVRAADPTPFDSVRGWSASPEGRAVAERVLREVGTTGDLRTARRRRFRGPLLLAAALLLVVGGASLVLGEKANDALAVGCYGAARLDADLAVISLGDASSPVEACAGQWRSLFGEPAPARLVACRLSDGGHGVFPVPDGQDPAALCAALGASPEP